MNEIYIAVPNSTLAYSKKKSQLTKKSCLTFTGLSKGLAKVDCSQDFEKFLLLDAIIGKEMDTLHLFFSGYWRRCLSDVKGFLHFEIHVIFWNGHSLHTISAHPTNNSTDGDFL